MVKLLPPLSEQGQLFSQVQRLQMFGGRLKASSLTDILLPCCKMSTRWKYFQITETVMVKLIISLSTFALIRADSLLHLPVVVTSLSFLYFLPILPPLFHLTSKEHLPLISLLSLPHPPFPALFPAQSSLQSWSLFPFQSFLLVPLSPPSSRFFPSSLSSWAQRRVILLLCFSLSFSQGQHFRDLLIGLELSIPSGWITEHRCKSPPAWTTMLSVCESNRNLWCTVDAVSVSHNDVEPREELAQLSQNKIELLRGEKFHPGISRKIKREILQGGEKYIHLIFSLSDCIKHKYTNTLGTIGWWQMFTAWAKWKP